MLLKTTTIFFQHTNISTLIPSLINVVGMRNRYIPALRKPYRRANEFFILLITIGKISPIVNIISSLLLNITTRVFRRVFVTSRLFTNKISINKIKAAKPKSYFKNIAHLLPRCISSSIAIVVIVIYNSIW